MWLTPQPLKREGVVSLKHKVYPRCTPQRFLQVTKPEVRRKELSNVGWGTPLLVLPDPKGVHSNWTDESVRRCTVEVFNINTVFRLNSNAHSVLKLMHSGYFYSASSSLLLLRSAPTTARILCQSFTLKSHRQLRMKDLPKVPMLRLERDLNPRPFER